MTFQVKAAVWLTLLGLVPGSALMAQDQVSPVDRGRALFLGQESLSAGGPACIACHSMNGITFFGGGSLATVADLNRYRGMGGDGSAVAPLLKAPPFMLMAEIYKVQPLTDDEVSAVAAFLVSEPDAGSDMSIRFEIVAIGGTVILLILFHLIWIKRIRGIRQSVVRGKS